MSVGRLQGGHLVRGRWSCVAAGAGGGGAGGGAGSQGHEMLGWEDGKTWLTLQTSLALALKANEGSNESR